MTPAVLLTLGEVLERARELGLLGPGDVSRHLAHARVLVGLLPPEPFRGLDLGSGGGVPGLVLAADRPDVDVVLLDSRLRSTRFLTGAVDGLGLSDRARVVAARAEEAARDPALRRTFDVVVARSFGPPAATAECAVGFLRPGGRLLVSEPPEGGASNDRWPVEGLAAMGFAPAAPRGDGATASFVQLTLVSPDDRWPRRVGLPARRPRW